MKDKTLAAELTVRTGETSRRYSLRAELAAPAGGAITGQFTQVRGEERTEGALGGILYRAFTGAYETDGLDGKVSASRRSRHRGLRPNIGPRCRRPRRCRRHQPQRRPVRHRQQFHLLGEKTSNGKEIAGLTSVDLNARMQMLQQWAMAGRLAAEHLLACGLRQFAAVGVGPGELHFADLRLAGFTERILAERLDCAVADPQWGPETWRAAVRLDPGAAELLDWLRGLPKPVGLFAVSHTIGPLLVQACRLLGLQVPAEVAVVAVDNDTVHCESIHPAISSVALNGFGVGLEAAQLLERLLGGGGAPVAPLVLPPGAVVARGSSAMPSAGSDAVAAAVAYIQNHFQRPLYVEEIARHVGLSRWHLQRLLLKQRGCSLVEEINRTRLRRAKELLTGTDLPTAEVARLCGFARREYFSVLFSRVVGDSPGQYRRHSQRGNPGANPRPPLPGLDTAAGPAAATAVPGGS